MTQIRLNLPLLRMRIHERFGTQAAFARRCGWSRQYVSRILGGHSAMSMERVGELAAALELTLDEIVQLSDSKGESTFVAPQASMSAIVREVADTYAAAHTSADATDAGKEDVSDLEKALTSWEPEHELASEEERIAFVRSLRGKYRDALSPTEEFMRRKWEETLREDEPIGLRS